DPAVLCLAPGEWLVCSERMEFSQLSRPLKAALDTRLTTVLDFSAGLTVLRLEGSGVPWLLNKLCPLDVQGGMNRGSHCARTRLQQAGVVLHCRESSGPASTRVFDLIVDRSLARYTRDLLIASIPHAEELNRSFGNRL
ncbi:MAG: hypothetical protein ACREO9_08405, partial [Lysobacterales bacterium]